MEAEAVLYLVRVTYQRQESCDRQLREGNGRLRAISVPYDLAVQRNGERSTPAGTLRLTLDGHGRLARVMVRQMKPPFPFLQVPLQQWCSRFLNEDFSNQRLVEMG